MMLEERVYTIGELASYLKESSAKNKNEFKPLKGKNVDSEDTKNNKKAIDDIMKDVDKNSGANTVKKGDKKDEETHDYNKTTLDVRLDYDPGEKYKARIKAQIHGFPSEDNEKNSDVEDSGANVDGGKKFYDIQKKKSEKLNKRHAEIQHAGLKSRMFPEEYFDNKTMFEESKKMKRLHFKNTHFLSESQMFGMVPESYKTDGNVFIMRDNTGTDYLVECKVDDTFGTKHMRVINKMNKQSVNEQLDRMRELYNFRK